MVPMLFNKPELLHVMIGEVEEWSVSGKKFNTVPVWSFQQPGLLCFREFLCEPTSYTLLYCMLSKQHFIDPNFYSV